MEGGVQLTLTVQFSSRGFHHGSRRRLHAQFCAALKRIACDTGAVPEEIAAQFLEVALIEGFEKRYGQSIARWLVDEPARLDNGAGRMGAAGSSSALPAAPATC